LAQVRDSFTGPGPRVQSCLDPSSRMSSMATSFEASTDAIPDARLILGALRALRKGDFTMRLPMDQIGMAGAIAEAFNDIAQQIADSANELERLSVAVGKEGKIDQRLSLRAPRVDGQTGSIRSTR